MRIEIKYLTMIMVCALTACSSEPTAENYAEVMNTPTIKSGESSEIDANLANKNAWNEVTVTQMTAVRRLPDGHYAPDANMGVLTVRAVLVNEGDTPVQGNWRCRFFDSNGLPLYEDENNLVAKTPTGLGWHRMIVYPVKSRMQTDEANVIRCQAEDTLATDYRVEFHDTSNDVKVYKR